MDRLKRPRLAIGGALLLVGQTLQAAVLLPCLCAMAPELLTRAHPSHASHRSHASPEPPASHGPRAAPEAQPACDHAPDAACPRHPATPPATGEPSVCTCDHSSRALVAAVLGVVGIPRAPLAVATALQAGTTVPPTIPSTTAADVPPLSPPPRA